MRLKDLTLGDWYKLVMTVSSVSAMVVGELLPETAHFDALHHWLTIVGTLSTAVHAALLRPEVAGIFTKATAQLFTLGASFVAGCIHVTQR
jgi:hypothetical protein